MTAQQLKNAILQLAIQGKLVPQDKADEPVSALLAQIKEEKARLVKEKKIKKDKNPSDIFRAEDGKFYERNNKGEAICIDEELPFSIPESWCWVRLYWLSDMYTGNSINEREKASKYAGLADGRSYIATKDVGFDHKISYENGVHIPYTNDKFKIAPKNSILLCIEGGSAGRKIAITRQDVCFGNKLCCFNTFGFYSEFLYYYLQSSYFKSIFKDKTTGIIGGVGVNKLKDFLVPLPPLAEQKRIVEKLEQLLPLVEEYGKAEQELILLDKKFLKELKKSILQLAIEGKLIPQNPADEPVEKLLERINQEKQKLIKEKKIKKTKTSSQIIRRDNSHYVMCAK